MMKSLFTGASLVLIASVASIAACAPREIIAASAVVADAAPSTQVAISVPAGNYASDPNHSSITFKVQHIGLSNYTMRFRTFDATVAFDPANIPASSVTAKVKPSDILVGYPDDYLKNHPGTAFKSWEDDLANSTKFLNAKEFPEISFKSTSVEVTGERNAKVTGDLTLLGVTKPVVLQATFDGEAASHPFAKVAAVGFSATGTFKRSDFGLGAAFPAEIIGDDVTMSIEGDFIQKVAS